MPWLPDQPVTLDANCSPVVLSIAIFFHNRGWSNYKFLLILVAKE